MTSHPKDGPRIPARGYKRKIAILEAENADLQMALAETERKKAFLERRFVVAYRIQLDVLKDVKTRAQILAADASFDFAAFCEHIAAEAQAVARGEYSGVQRVVGGVRKP